jgi:hypothetical protein
MINSSVTPYFSATLDFINQPLKGYQFAVSKVDFQGSMSVGNTSW